MALETDHFRIRPISEGDIDAVVAAAGGGRAHPEAGRKKRGADYRLGEAIIELKTLDEDGFGKPERQAKLAALFGAHAGERPVVVLDPALLPDDEQRAYRNIIEGPILSAAKSAKGQLAQSRIEHPDATLSVLMVVNNGYTALNNKQICNLAAHRARQFLEIDGVVVGGCYFHSDGFDSFFLWPLDYVPINVGKSFPSFEQLREAWNDHASSVMTKMMTDPPKAGVVKGPVVDTEFSLDGKTYVKPAPPMGAPSEFYGPKRPRKNSTGLRTSPAVGLIFPDIGHGEWSSFQDALDDGWDLGEDYEAWKAQRREALSSGTVLRPLVPVAVSFEGWRKAWSDLGPRPTMQTLQRYAVGQFQSEIQRRLATARERKPDGLIPARYILACTDEIGRDKANDVSAILSVVERPDVAPSVRVLANNLRIFHEYAVTLAGAYAVAEGVESVLWQTDDQYAWT